MDKILRYENYISSQKINEEYEIEEEAGEYKGTTYMKELAKMLGVSVVGNKIDYEGQEINFYSETEKFHIGDKDFTTPEEAYDYLTGENPEGKNSPYEEEENNDLTNIEEDEEIENEDRSKLRNDIEMEADGREEETESEEEEEEQDWEKIGQDIQMKNSDRRELRNDVESEKEEMEYTSYNTNRNVKSFNDFFAINEEEILGFSKEEKSESRKSKLVADLDTKVRNWSSKGIKFNEQDRSSFMSAAQADGFAGRVGFDSQTKKIYYKTKEQVAKANMSGRGVGDSFA